MSSSISFAKLDDEKKYSNNIIPNKDMTTKPSTKRQQEIQKLVNSVKKNKTIWVKGRTKPFLHDFIKIKQLGDAGQYGETHQCKRKKDGTLVAVKYLNKNRFYRIPIKNRPKYMAAMCDEIDILQTLNHDYIVQLLNVYEDSKFLYIIMEECKGGTLLDRVVQRKKYEEKDAANIIKQLLSALRYMHNDNNIVHADLKPENILFATEEEDSPIKIIDFGMSKVLPRLEYLKSLRGTPYYTAPEVIQKRKYNHACDLWSVGVILYLIIYGYPPFYVCPTQNMTGKNEMRAIYAKVIQGFEPVIKRGYGPWFPHHIKTSSQVKDLISKLLQSQVRKRYTAQEALSHPWIVNRVNNKNYVDKCIISRLIGFNNICQFKLAIAKIFRQQFYKMRPEHFHQLEQLFMKFDVDSDGILSFQEFAAAVKSIDDVRIEENHLLIIYKQLAASQNYNGQKHVVGIRFSDLLNALVYDYLVACDERLYDAFRKLDEDNDGKITTKQLQQKLKIIDPLGEWDTAMKIIEQQSNDKNGVIDYEEFLLKLHPNFEEKPDWMQCVSFGRQQKPEMSNEHKAKMMHK